MKLIIYLLTLTSFLLFFRLGATALTNWDEAWLASVSQDIIQRNDWLAGRLNGQTWFYEPPILTWILALIYKIVGQNEFWLRFPNAICGFLTIVVVYKLSILLTKSKASAFISCLILLSDIEFLFRSRQINVEIPLTLALIGCVFALYYAKAANKPTWFYISAFLYGVSFLIKRASPVLALPAILWIFFSGYKTKPQNHLKIFTRCLAIFCVTAASWYLYAFLRWKNQFIDEFFLGYTVGKIKTANQIIGTSSFFYFSALRHAFKIWSLFIPPALIWIILKIKKQKVFLPLLVYVLTFFVALTLAPIKSSWYLLPIHPVIALFIGIFLNKVFPKNMNRLVLFGTLVIFALQTIKYRASYIVPDTTGHQAQIASYVKALTAPEDTIYLDDDYLPVAVFYSQRKIVPLRFNRLSRQNLPISFIKSGHLALSNSETIDHLRQNIPNHLPEIYRISDLILLRSESD